MFSLLKILELVLVVTDLVGRYLGVRNAVFHNCFGVDKCFIVHSLKALMRGMGYLCNSSRGTSDF